MINRVSSRLYKLIAATSIFVFVSTIACLAFFDVGVVYEPPLLLPILNTVFIFAVSLVVAYLSARSYLADGSPISYLMNIGTLLFGITALVTGWLMGLGGPNVSVTIFNIGALFSSVVHCASAISALSGASASLGSRKLKLLLSYLGVSALMAWLAIASLQGAIPPFFIQGVGPTPLRQLVLGTAVALFIASSLLFFKVYYASKSDVVFWYSLALALTGLGLFAVAVTRTVGGPVGWTGRSAQYLGGIYFLLSVIAARRYTRIERLPLEKALTAFFRESGQNYSVLTEMAPDAIVSMDELGRVLSWNKAAERIFGYSGGEAIGSSLFDLIVSDERIDAARKDFVRAGRPFIPFGVTGKTIDIQAKRKNGEVFPAEFSLATRKTDGGWVTTGIARDITQRKRMDEVIDLARQYAENIVSTVRDPLLVLDSDLRIVSANRSFYEHFKVNPTETEGKSLYELGDRQWDNPDLRRLLEEILPAKSVINDFELIHVFPTIGQRVMLLNARKVLAEPSGKQLILLAIEDITERKRMDEMKDQFISAVTHELRTPLVSVKGYVDYVLTEKLGALPREIKSSLEVAKRNTDVLIQLVDDLLDIQRLTRGAIELKMESLDLRKLVQDCVENVKHSIQENGHSLELKASESELPIQGDRIRLTQVVMNVLNNAIKFTPNGGRITVRVNVEDERVQVQVSDTGIGIRAEDLPRVFEPFAAIKKPTYIKGTGLGLSVAKGFIEAHGGKMWAESPGEGKGATLTFTLPRRKEMS